MIEVDARERYVDFIVASLGAIRKEKPGGVVTARVLFRSDEWHLREPPGPKCVTRSELRLLLTSSAM